MHTPPHRHPRARLPLARLMSALLLPLLLAVALGSQSGGGPALEAGRRVERLLAGGRGAEHIVLVDGPAGDYLLEVRTPGNAAARARCSPTSASSTKGHAGGWKAAG